MTYNLGTLLLQRSAVPNLPVLGLAMVIHSIRFYRQFPLLACLCQY